MTTPYHQFVSEYAQLLRVGKALPMGGFASHPNQSARADAPLALIFSPHPDDECIIGGLALRLMRENGVRIANVAVTQGSKKERQKGRWRELQQACDFIGYELIQTVENGLESVNPKTRGDDPAFWSESVACIRKILESRHPDIIFFPHANDWNSTHIGTHWLVTDALHQLGAGFKCAAIETEFWGQMADPNLMIESSAEDLGDLVAGTSFHIGEVSRNPFHLFLPAWMQDNVRLGSELVGGQGEAAPAFSFATLYRFRQWSGAKFEALFEGGRQVSCSDNPGKLFHLPLVAAR